jgi:hypothetical protein
MKRMFTVGLLLGMCSSCNSEDVLTLKEVHIASSSYAGEKLLLKTCFGGGREGAYLVDCQDNSIQMGFELSDQLRKNKVATADLLRCIYRATSPKPNNELAVTLRGVIRKVDNFEGAYVFVARDVHQMCVEKAR